MVSLFEYFHLIPWIDDKSYEPRVRPFCKDIISMA